MICKYCNSNNLYTEQKGNNLGLYCSDCGKWQKWLNKDEYRVYSRETKETVTNEQKIRADVIDEVMDILKAKIGEKEYPIETMVELTDLGVKILELKDSK